MLSNTECCRRPEVASEAETPHAGAPDGVGEDGGGHRAGGGALRSAAAHHHAAGGRLHLGPDT